MYPNEEASNAVQNIQLANVQLPHPTIVPELAQLHAFQHTICTLNKVIALQETVVGNVHVCAGKLCSDSGLFHSPGTEIAALNLLIASLVHNYSHFN